MWEEGEGEEFMKKLDELRREGKCEWRNECEKDEESRKGVSGNGNPG